MSENGPLRGKVWLISELADFEVVRNWETDRFGFPVVECVCPHCGYEFSEEDIKKLAKVEFNDEEVVRLEDIKSAVNGLLKEIEEDGELYNTDIIKEKIKKWLADVFE